MATAVDLHFADIQVGAQASFRHAFTERDIDDFARLSGDYSPLHVDHEYASNTPFGRRLVHGMLLASLVSRLVGMHLPGRRNLCLSQSFDFIQPVYANDPLEVWGEVQHKQEATKALYLRTEIRILPDRVAVRGKALVKVLE